MADTLNENMHKRRIQLVAGTTYSVSLPKEWVKKHKLKEKNEIVLTECSDGSLSIAGSASRKDKHQHDLSKITIDVENYLEDIDQILLAAYYMGANEITLLTKTPLHDNTLFLVRKTINHMGGTEIIYEDKEKIKIQVMLDISNVNMKQLISRMILILKSMLANLSKAPSEISLKEIKLFEQESDRLYHLISKILINSTHSTSLLSSSGISNCMYIPSYNLVAKKLENIADNFDEIAELVISTGKNFENKKEIFQFIDEVIERCNRKILKSLASKRGIFRKTHTADREKIKQLISKIKDISIRININEIIRFLDDIECEFVNLSFYKNVREDKPV